MEVSEESLERFFSVMSGVLDERERRLLVGAAARMLGRGGPTVVARAAGVSRNTVMSGSKEIDAGAVASDRVRREGGGPPKLIDLDPDLLLDLDDLVEPDSRGDPMSPLRWTLKSTRKLADALVGMGHQVSHMTVHHLLREMGYSLQATAKTVEGAQHPDRNAQFEHINALVKRFLAAGQPVVSVDCKKKELVGTEPGWANAGREYQPKARPRQAGVHDFPDPDMPKAIPYGVLDVGANQGWGVSVGDHHDTAAFAVNAIRRWWETMGAERYPKAKRLTVTADAGGSNGYRSRLWKLEIARLAVETGLDITVCHYPPGTSKWNKIEHRLFSFITIRRGRELTSYRTIVELIGATTTDTGLSVRAEWDQGYYPTGTVVTNDELAAINIKPDKWHGEWNYTLSHRPNGQPQRVSSRITDPEDF